MELISTIGLVVSPFLIKWITSGVKRISTVRFAEGKTFILRFVVAALSFVSAVILAWMNGVDINADIISVFADAIVTFISATGLYFWAKHREAKV